MTQQKLIKLDDGISWIEPTTPYKVEIYRLPLKRAGFLFWREKSREWGVMIYHKRGSYFHTDNITGGLDRPKAILLASTIAQNINEARVALALTEPKPEPSP